MQTVMLDPSLPLQAALFAALSADGVLPAVVGGRVYDAVPQNAQTPYVALGACQVLPDKSGCIDGSICYPIIDVWSTYQGFAEAKQIAAAILAKLDDQPENLSVTGFQVVVFEIENYQPLLDPDGISRRVSLTFKALVNPA